jgi:hypothetical protein
VKPNLKIYSETDQPIAYDDITSDKTIISILEIQGLKFTSRNFQIEIELKQTMVVSPDPFLDSCFIKKPTKHVKDDTPIHQQQQIPSDLNNLINQSVLDITNNHSDLSEPIDLEVSFDAPKDTPDLEETNIELDIEDLEPKVEEKEDPNVLKEVDLLSTLDNSLEAIQLKKPTQVYYELYQKAKEKAKEAKKTAIDAYIEMKNIKTTYMIDDVDSDSDLNSDSDCDSDTNN